MAATMKGADAAPPPSLDDLAAKVQSAADSVQRARAALATDKQQRTGSLVARLVDALTSTAPEKVLIEAEASLGVARERGWAAARAWIVATATRRLFAQPAEAQRHREQTLRLARVRRRAEHAQRWQRLAREAEDSLSSARDACSSASDAETLDLFTKSKAVSVLSSLDTADASAAINRARRAVQALAQALPKRTEQPDIERPDDLLDLVVDLTTDLPFDLTSLFAIDALDTAEIQCTRAAEQLRPLGLRLARLAADTKAKAEQEAAALHGIEAPYLQAAAAEVPALLRVPAPAGLAS